MIEQTLTLKTAPATEPVSQAEAKLHLRVDHTADDDLIDDLIEAARNYGEERTWRAFITQTWTLEMDTFPRRGLEIRIPKPPLRAINSITYTDADGDEQTLTEDTDFYVATNASRVVPVDHWPATQSGLPLAVSIEFEAGYGNAGDIPPLLKSALLMKIADLYEYRTSEQTGTIISRHAEAAGRLFDLFSARELV